MTVHSQVVGSYGQMTILTALHVDLEMTIELEEDNMARDILQL